MKLLALDTATERCSVALRLEGSVTERIVETQRGHADLILSLVQEVLEESSASLRDLHGIAYGRGPGAFTGVRIAVGVAQGLAFGAELPVVGVSDLAAVAQQFARPGQRALVCMDARMNEVYWARFDCNQEGRVEPASREHVGPPASVEGGRDDLLVGSGFAAYPLLVQQFPHVAPIHALPRAREVALLGEAMLARGEGQPAHLAQPVYLRDQVATPKRSGA